MIWNKLHKEKDLTRLTRYWFIDTCVDCGVSKIYIIDGKLEKMDKFNKSIGNFFTTKKDAELALLILKEKTKAKKI